ncbi:nitroreductase [Bermanella sp. WJH001]|uniref:nitroreductase n=1 Tax=Bermanella sp. WJH001 TaxID=3048005 RepID=UPI0024BEB7EA|nr:nitroreductase [Bermanella sp. WJH001]MDJ1537684.1 nitroreductase [Bermanella sp. WJH001]
MTINSTLSLEDAIRQRRSVRGFKPDLIEPELIEHILQTAQLSPSNCNVQPWQVLLATGDACSELKQKMHHAFMHGQNMNPDFSALPKFEGVMRNRQVECAQALYGAMGIERGDKIARMKATARNYEFFDAPHVLFIAMKKDFSPSIAVDVGMYAQTLMLLMTAHGIGSCAQASTAYYPNIVRDYFEVDDDLGILFGISFGYEDQNINANTTRTSRAPLNEVLITKG